MNKTSFKRLTMILLSLMLILVLSFTMIACNDETPDDDDKEPVTDTLTLKNGNFEFFTGTEFPAAPKNWTGKENVSHDKDDKTDYVDAGVISVKEGEYSPSDFGGAANPGKVGEDDDYVLMINNLEKTSYTYTSTSVSLADAYYVFTINVKTVISSETADAGAYIRLTNGGSRVYTQFELVNTNGQWQKYEIFVRGPEISNRSVYIELALGNGTKADADTLAKGYAYFDSVYCDESDAAGFAAASNKYDFTVPNGELLNVYSSTSYPKSPYDWATETGKDEDGNNIANTEGVTATGVINTSSELWDPKYILSSSEKNDNDIVSSIVNPGTHDGATDSNMLVIRSNKPTAKGYYTTSSIRFKKGSYYKLSVWIKTELVSGSVTIKLGNEITIDNVNTAGDWKEYSIFVESSYTENNDLALHVWLGQGDKLNTENYAQGTVYIDSLTRTEYVTDTEYNNAYNAIDAAYKTQKSFVKTNMLSNILTVDGSSTDYIKDASFWSGAYAEDHGTPYDSVYGVVDLSSFNSSELGDIAAIDPVINRDTKALVIWNKKNGAYTLKYDTDNNLDTNDLIIAPNTSYRLSMWVMTVGAKTGTGISAHLITTDDNGNETTLSSVTVQNTESTDSDGVVTNDWREITFYVQGAASENKEISIKFELGSGNYENPSLYVAGHGFVSNIYLEECTYAKYSSASTATTTQKYSFASTVSTTIANGGFNNYKVDSSADSFDDNGAFNRMPATPNNWTGAPAGSGSAAAPKDNVISGIVNAAVVSYLNTNHSLPVSSLPYDSTMDINYNGAPNALMIWNKQPTAYGYTLTSQSMSANSYYMLSVNVNTTAGAKAAIVIENETNNASFVAIDTTTDAENVNGWVKYTFYIEVGLQSSSIDIGLWLGQGNAAATTTHSDGVAFFDNVYLKNITSEINDVDEDAGETPDTKWNAITETSKVKKLSLKTDSFTTSVTTNPSTPSNFTGAVDGKAPSGSDYTSAGVIDVTQQIENTTFGDLDIASVFAPENGPNMLLIYNKDLTAYNYTSTQFSFAKDSYYMVSVKVKTNGLTDGKGANLNLILGDSTYKMADKALVVSDSGWTTYTFLVDTANTAKYAKLVLGLGIYAEDDDDKAVTTDYAKGYVAFDDVVFDALTETEYTDLKNAVATGSTTDYVITLEDEDEKSNTGSNEGDISEGDSLSVGEIVLIVSGSIIGIAIVVVIVVLIVKKITPKIKAKRNKKYKKASYDKNAISKDAVRKTKNVDKYKD